MTFSTITGGKELSGYYSFVEDFKRDQRFRDQGSQGWLRQRLGENGQREWEAVTKAKFTADSNPVVNINAGVKDDHFFLVTGGKTENTDVKLGESMRLTAEAERRVPEGLPTLP